MLQKFWHQVIKIEIHAQRLKHNIKQKLYRVRRIENVIDNRRNTSNGQPPPHNVIRKPKWNVIESVFKQPVVLRCFIHAF